jgi:hypothetical protein
MAAEEANRSLDRNIAAGGLGSFAHCRIFENGRSAANLLSRCW